MTETFRRFAATGFEQTGMRALGDGFVLTFGTVKRELNGGGAEALPSAWLSRVRAGRLSLLVYFRTVEEALANLPGNRGDRAPVAIAERLVESFNSRDDAALVSLAAEDYVFDSPLENGRRATGIAAAAELIAAIRQAESDYVVDSYEATDIGEGFVVLEATILTAGAPRRTRRTWLLRVEAGLLHEATIHPNAAAAVLAADNAA